MKDKSITLLLAATVAAPAAIGAEGAPGDPRDPFSAYVAAGTSYEDNLFRLSDSAEAEELVGTPQLDDWYGYAEAGFAANRALDRQRYEVSADVRRQMYDTFDFLDHTGGHFAAAGTWEMAADSEGTLGYRYRRHLQSFTNKDVTTRDMVREHAVHGSVERPFLQRWLLRFDAEGRDLGFSTSEFLDKQQLDGQVELRYAASQQSTFGISSSYTSSDFDDGNTRDFSGWSVGPIFDWQVTRSLLLTTNLGYTHRGQDVTDGTQSDYDGVTGYAAGTWTPGDRFSSELRVFRDVSSLGGEISEYTERTGLRLRPTWKLTTKLTSSLQVAYEQRDFSTVETAATDRQDDYLLTELTLDFAATRKLLVSLGYGYEYRDSNVDGEDFDAQLVHAAIRWKI